MKWVKASEKLPPIVKDVVIRDTNGYTYADRTNNGWDKGVADYEWLDESEEGDNQEELWNEVGKKMYDIFCDQGFAYASTCVDTIIKGLKQQFVLTCK